MCSFDLSFYIWCWRFSEFVSLILYNNVTVNVMWLWHTLRFLSEIGPIVLSLSAALHLKVPCQRTRDSSLRKASSSLWGAFILEVHSHLLSSSSRFLAVSEVAAWPPVAASFPRSMVCRKSENRSHFLSHTRIGNNKGYSKVVGCCSYVWKYRSSCFQYLWYFFLFFFMSFFFCT